MPDLAACLIWPHHMTHGPCLMFDLDASRGPDQVPDLAADILLPEYCCLGRDEEEGGGLQVRGCGDPQGWQASFLCILHFFRILGNKNYKKTWVASPVLYGYYIL